MKKVFGLVQLLSYLTSALTASAVLTATASADENCTKDKKKALCEEAVVKATVDRACKVLGEQGKDGIAEIKKLRFDCCGEPDYVWIQTFEPKMIMHPVKAQLDGQDLSSNVDPDGKKLFVEFAKSAKATPSGGWVKYKWTKLGESDPTPKKSWIKKCKVKGETEDWIAGSGTWY
jgi:signal transduction histidine kinase